MFGYNYFGISPFAGMIVFMWETIDKIATSWTKVSKATTSWVTQFKP